MDKARDFGSGDCRFESCHGRLEWSPLIRLFENPKSKTTLIATAFNCYIAATGIHGRAHFRLRSHGCGCILITFIVQSVDIWWVMGCLNVKFCPPDDEPVMMSRGTQVYDGEVICLRSHCHLQDMEVARLEHELDLAKAEVSRFNKKYWRLELNERLAGGNAASILV